VESVPLRGFDIGWETLAIEILGRKRVYRDSGIA
jgi:hypothetical protein